MELMDLICKDLERIISDGYLSKQILLFSFLYTCKYICVCQKLIFNIWECMWYESRINGRMGDGRMEGWMMDV